MNLDQLDLGLVDVQKCKKFLPKFFFGRVLSCYYGFTNYFEILIFSFSNSIPRGVSTCKILLFYKFSLNPKFWSFQSDLANFDEQFLLIHTTHQAEIFRIIISYILQQLRNFLSNSEIGNVQASKILHHLVWNDPFMILSTSSMLIRDLSMSDLNLYLFMCKCVINNEQLLQDSCFLDHTLSEWWAMLL